MKISLVSVFVENPNEAFKIYTGKLGFQKKIHMPEMNLAIVVSAEEPEGTAILLEPDQNLGAREWRTGIYKAGLPYIVFGSKDIHKEYEELKAKGVIFRGEPTKTDWGTQVLFEDECGNLIQLAQTAPQ